MSDKALIFGTGSVGAVYSYILCNNIFGNDLNCRPRVARSVQEAVDAGHGPYNFILVTAKALPSKPSIPDLLRPAITSTTAIALIQNGIAIEELYAKAYPNNPLISCVAYLPVTQTSLGTFKHSEVETLHLGTYPANLPKDSAADKAAAKLTTLLQQGGATAHHHADLQSKRWAKLLVNASWNPICALSRSPDATFMHSSSDPPYAAEFVQAVMLEIASIANAVGYPEISKETVEWQMGRAKKRDLPGVEPSMLADARRGGRMEVDAIVGNAVRIAAEKGVDVPMLRALLVLVRGLDESFGRDAAS
ncbi:putative 2-dehydropantoate [Cyphellophora attinorum]|uniref:Putative 2-dehydropantoate n=1 Tax=Cyphellophora attinorum TaxID=1664694 RepID=A0A0N1HC05_9EURO|nr:putative 2-dehydropantoate [Phialophora attinorum]KPI41117.1 putative 2-dehydropantoate [Phialophora attinorum]